MIGEGRRVSSQGRGLPRRRPVATALGLAAALMGYAGLVAEALATPTLDEATRFARRELAQLCDDVNATRFDRVSDRLDYRACNALVTRDRMSLEIRYRTAADAGEPRQAPSGPAASPSSTPMGQRVGAVAIDVALSRDTRFFCGRGEGQASMVGLYLSCEREISFDGARCVSRSESLRRPGRATETRTAEQSVAKLFELSSGNCVVMENALNFIAERSRPSRDGDIRAYFNR